MQGEVIRAARCFMDWTRNDLAKRAGISPETVKNIETGKYHPNEQTISAIKSVFSEHDIEFSEGGMSHRPRVKTCPQCGYDLLNPPTETQEKTNEE